MTVAPGVFEGVAGAARILSRDCFVRMARGCKSSIVVRWERAGETKYRKVECSVFKLIELVPLME